MIRDWVWGLLKRLLFRFDAETVHHLSVSAMRAPRWALVAISGRPRPVPADRTLVWGREFASRVGLAAGFDKQGDLTRAMPALGFGFSEIGTVTPRPQPGNPRPRLFRDSERGALFNRMGFNSLGADEVARRLCRARVRGVPSDFRIGVNLGKNKETPASDAWRDYAEAARRFEGLADYLVVNLSSPNTPGLRALQSADSLRPIVEGVRKVTQAWSEPPPLLVKLAPELRGPALTEILVAGDSWGVDGWVLTNTWGGEGGIPTAPGGWSGKILTAHALESLIEARSITARPIVSVGGIMSPEDARARIRAGASLVQLYSGWVYGGPAFPGRVALALRDFR